MKGTDKNRVALIIAGEQIDVGSAVLKLQIGIADSGKIYNGRLAEAVQLFRDTPPLMGSWARTSIGRFSKGI